MVLEALEKILDINFAPDINISNVCLINIEGGDKLEKEGQSLKVNIDELEPDERAELLELPPERFEIQERILNEDDEKETAAIEEGFDESEEEILDYFDDILSDDYLSILDMALHLRALIEQKDLTKEEIQERKREIAKYHGPDAIYMASLTTAGYFDPDGGVRDIYVDMELNDQYDRYKFQQRLEELVEHKLLCVFVESNDSVEDTTQAVRRRVAKYQRRDPVNSWMDLRGIGGQCEEIIDETINNLEEEYIGIDYDRWMEDDQLIVRMYPRSFPNLTS